MTHTGPHKYRGIKTTKDKTIWRCVLPGCTHVLYQPELLPGRITLCWTCNEPTMIKDLIQKKPVCDDCAKFRKDRLEKLKKIS